ncbi:MAG: acetyl-CoA C-acyltransferase [Candidatus Omnitrophica bacterium]|nr:acetyl-CoA C-acyltransferase [Candidatus Omnitrophota bacterium]
MNPIGLKRGYRTPFVKKDTAFASINPVELSVRLVNGMLERADFPVGSIEHVIWGMVVPDANIYSIAREVVLGSKLDNRVEAYSVSRACATSMQAAANAASYYHVFPAEKSMTLAGGVESFSSVRPVLTHAASRYFKSLAEKGSFLEKLGRALKIPVMKLLPVPPAAREYSTGLTMGEHCELMIKEFKISRERQDALALASHKNASKARPEIRTEIIPIAGVESDSLIRDNASMEALAALSVAFDRKSGTITAGNASPYTDGAAAVYVISPALELAVKPDAYLKDFEFVGVDPDSGLLMGPGKAMLNILQRHNLKWKDIDYIDMHEAFAGQVLSVVDALNQPDYRKNSYGVDYDPGFLDEKTLNPWGSSIAYGHPFGATGARMLNQAITYLARQNKQFALIAACTAGALAGACLVTRQK